MSKKQKDVSGFKREASNEDACTATLKVVDGDEGITCWCDNKITIRPGNIRLGCKCSVHYHCLVGVIKSWTKDIHYIQEWGIPCPYQNECGYKQQYGRTVYISDAEMDFLAEYGEVNRESLISELSPADKEIAFLDSIVIGRFKLLQREKRFQLSCGCYIHYEDLTRWIRRGLDNEILSVGIECPNRVSDACQGLAGMYIHRFEISSLISAGLEFRKEGLLPRSDMCHLTRDDLQAFDDRFHRHVQLECGCFVHLTTAMTHLESILRVSEAEDIGVADNMFAGVGVPSGAVVGQTDHRSDHGEKSSSIGCSKEPVPESDTYYALLRCPHGKRCKQFVTDGAYSHLTEKDIDAIIAGVPKTADLSAAFVERSLQSVSSTPAYEQVSFS